MEINSNTICTNIERYNQQIDQIESEDSQSQSENASDDDESTTNDPEYDEVVFETYDSCNLACSTNELVKKLLPITGRKETTVIGLLALFFSGKFTQSAFGLVCEFSRIVNIDTRFSLTSFDSCVNLIFKYANENIKFQKQYYCKQCNCIKTHEIKDRYARNCSKCNTRFNENFLFFNSSFFRNLNLLF